MAADAHPPHDGAPQTDRRPFCHPCLPCGQKRREKEAKARRKAGAHAPHPEKLNGPPSERHVVATLPWIPGTHVTLVHVAAVPALQDPVYAPEAVVAVHEFMAAAKAKER